MVCFSLFLVSSSFKTFHHSVVVGSKLPPLHRLLGLATPRASSTLAPYHLPGSHLSERGFSQPRIHWSENRYELVPTRAASEALQVKRRDKSSKEGQQKREANTSQRQNQWEVFLLWDGTLAQTILTWERFLCVKKQGHTYMAAWATENTSCLLTLAIPSFST